MRLALFAGVVGAATLFDVYFDAVPLELEKTEHESRPPSDEPGTIYLINQAGPASAKVSVQKTGNRNFFEHLHDKFLREYHEAKNYCMLKAEEKNPGIPLFLSCYYLIFRNYYFTFPDDDIPLS